MQSFAVFSLFYNLFLNMPFEVLIMLLELVVKMAACPFLYVSHR